MRRIRRTSLDTGEEFMQELKDIQNQIDEEKLRDIFDALKDLRQKFVDAKLLPTQYCSYLIGECAHVLGEVGFTKDDFIKACEGIYDIYLEK